VQQVVQALGHPEELRVAVEHEPAVLDPGALAVGDQGLQHLRHATALRGRVDVPDHPVAEGGSGALGIRASLAARSGGRIAASRSRATGSTATSSMSPW
jgi:hypothetical protein